MFLRCEILPKSTIDFPPFSHSPLPCHSPGCIVSKVHTQLLNLSGVDSPAVQVSRWGCGVLRTIPALAAHESRAPVDEVCCTLNDSAAHVVLLSLNRGFPSHVHSEEHPIEAEKYRD